MATVAFFLPCFDSATFVLSIALNKEGTCQRQDDVMRDWDGFKFGPLHIYWTECRLLAVDGSEVSLGQREFNILLRLMSCHGGVVSSTMLARNLLDHPTLRMSICRLRKFLKRHFGNLVTIVTCQHYGYKLSLSGEFSLS